MEVIDNINHLLGDNLKQAITPGSKLKIAASCFSIYAFAALKQELEGIESLEFIFTSPTFVPNEVTDKLKKERRQFHIPKLERERSFYGSEFEIQLKNQEVIAGKQVFFMDSNALAACFETGMNEEFVKSLAARHPLRVVFRDSGFGSDSVKINIEQIFKLVSPTTEVKSI